MDKLIEFLANSDSKAVRVLAVLNSLGGGPRHVKVIRDTAISHGLRAARVWNISQILKDTKGAATPHPDGWKLTSKGKAILANSGWNFENPDVQNVIDDLVQHTKKIKDADRKAFVDEAIGCFNYGFNRAAIVLSWTGAIAVLHDHIFQKHLASFNTEGKRQGLWKKDVKVESDLYEIKEFDLLQVTKAIGVIDKNVKQKLEEALRLRNSCGHPNKLQIGNRTVAAHMEILVLNVFSRI